ITTTTRTSGRGRKTAIEETGPEVAEKSEPVKKTRAKKATAEEPAEPLAAVEKTSRVTRGKKAAIQVEEQQEATSTRRSGRGKRKASETPADKAPVMTSQEEEAVEATPIAQVEGDAEGENVEAEGPKPKRQQ